ncbi:MAG: tripartite tricarboxylate transporter substrate binding protein [Alphaproteobacteria bacterium]|nr:tripartite tricarboxylate transporter substrate binding protein [Alphaproteobacteria bacterium]
MLNRRSQSATAAACCLAAALMAAPAQAQQWPQQPVKIIVSAAAGGPIDVFGRVIAERLSQLLGQQAVIENVPGAGARLGGARVAKAAPDGYSVLLGTSATHTFSQVLVKDPPYSAEKDFEPVTLIGEIPLVLITRPDFPASDMKGFVAHAKANPGKLNYGSAGAGSAAHLGCALLASETGIEAQHVPYRGTAPAMQDLQAGRIDFLCDIVVTAAPQIEGGKVKAMATLAAARWATLPKVPSAVEAGFPSVQAYSFTALYLPAKMPPVIVERLRDAAIQAMDTPAVKA